MHLHVRTFDRPAHPDTILATLSYMQKAIVDMGMTLVHVSSDMQLFIVTKQVCWNQPEQFDNVIVHPGGMHIIQSFCACIANLMKGSALEIYVAAAYGGLKGIFNGKSWVKALRAFQGVSAALLKQFLSTGRHWVDNFLLPTLLIHQFICAEREGDTNLKLLTMERMMKYFLAGHVQYAHYLTQYLLEMRALDVEAKVDLVCRHHDGYWNAVSADQFGKQTAMKIGEGSLKGVTLSPELVCEWIDAFPITVHVADLVDTIYSPHTAGQSAQQCHKEELKHRCTLDANDRSLIETEVKNNPHPLEDNRPNLYNPVTGQIAPPDVNVADSIMIEETIEQTLLTAFLMGFTTQLVVLSKRCSCALRRSGLTPLNQPLILRVYFSDC